MSDLLGNITEGNSTAAVAETTATIESAVTQTNSASEASVATKETVASDFHSQLAEDLRQEASLQSFKDINSLAKSYVHAQKMIGSSVRLPSKDSTPEQIAEFYDKIKDIPNIANLEDRSTLYTKLGRPESPDKYNYGLPQELTENNQTLNEFSKVAHELGLNNEQAAKIANFQVQRELQAMEKVKADQIEGERILKQQWGSDYDTKLSQARAAAKMFATKYPEQVQALLSIPTIGNNPAFLDMLSKAGSSLIEQGHVQGLKSIQVSNAAEKLKAIKSNPAFGNSMDPNHNKLIAEYNDLAALVYGQS